MLGIDLPPLEMACISFELEAQESGRLPGYLGSTLRGAVGNALRRTSCPLRCQEPPSCFLRQNCAYAYCFETAIPQNSANLRNLSDAPRPFVIRPPRQWKRDWSKGDRLAFELLLFGRATKYFPHFLVAIKRAAEHGLGRDHIKFDALSARDYSSPGNPILWSREGDDLQMPELCDLSVKSANGTHPENRDRMSLNLLSPLRIMKQGKLLTNPSFRDFTRSLLARISNLYYFHASHDLDLDYRGLLGLADTVVPGACRPRLSRLNRWSNRQEREISLNGLVGSIEWRGEGLSSLAPLFRIGEYTHLGKGTVFGLGQYVIEATTNTEVGV